MGHVTLWEKYTSNCKWLSQNRSTKGNGENLASFILVPSSNYHASLQHVLDIDNKYSLWKLDKNLASNVKNNARCHVFTNEVSKVLLTVSVLEYLVLIG